MELQKIFELMKRTNADTFKLTFEGSDLFEGKEIVVTVEVKESCEK